MNGKSKCYSWRRWYSSYSRDRIKCQINLTSKFTLQKVWCHNRALPLFLRCPANISSQATPCLRSLYSRLSKLLTETHSISLPSLLVTSTLSHLGSELPSTSDSAWRVSFHWIPIRNLTNFSASIWSISPTQLHFGGYKTYLIRFTPYCSMS